jgi:hypothetical protein
MNNAHHPFFDSLCKYSSASPPLSSQELDPVYYRHPGLLA